jgi:hypothetical protein
MFYAFCRGTIPSSLTDSLHSLGAQVPPSSIPITSEVNYLTPSFTAACVPNSFLSKPPAGVAHRS